MTHPRELLALILALPEPRWDEAMDYGALGVLRGPESDLIEIATDPALLQADADTPESSAPVHAIRSLATIRSERAVAPLLDALMSGRMENDWMARELPKAFGAIGALATEPLLALAADRSRNLYARMVAVESLGEIGLRHEDDRDAAVAGLTRILQGFEGEDPTLNAMIVDELVGLAARESAPVMEAAFEAGAVEVMHMGDWEDVQIELGLLDERITPPGSSASTSPPIPLRGSRDLEAQDAEVVERFLRRPGRTWGPKAPRELEGFLFAVACAPEIVPAEDWFEALSEDGEPFEDLAGARTALDALITLYGIIEEDAHEPGLEAPEGIFRDDPMANFEEDAAVAQWSRGFVTGHSWLEELWEPSVDLAAEDDDELGAVLFVLSFFASRSLAEGYMREFTEAKSLEEMAATVRTWWSGALGEYAELGRTVMAARVVEEERRLTPVRAEVTPGRNDPCPCGSGRKYKKCCGRSVH